MPSRSAAAAPDKKSLALSRGVEIAGPPKMGKQQGDSNSDTATDQSIGQAHAGGNAQTQLDGGPMEDDDDALPEGAAMEEDDDEDDGVTPEHSTQAGDRRTTTVEAKDLPDINDHHVAVVCNDVRGAFLVTRQQVVCNCPSCLRLPMRQRTFTPCQFERHAGSKAKKWKISIKLDADAAEQLGLDLSDQPMTIGQYYDRRGIEVKPLYKKGGVGDVSLHPALAQMEDPSSTTCSGGSPADHAGPSRSSAEMLRKRKRAELAALGGTLVPASYPPRGGSFLAARYERAAHERRADFASTKREWPLGGDSGAEDGQEAIAGLMQLTRGASTDVEASWRRGEATATAHHTHRGSVLLSMRGGGLDGGLDGLAESSASFWRAKFDTLQTADAYYKHKAIFQLMYSIMEGADKKALYEEYLPILNDMDAFRLEQEFNTLWGFLDLMHEADFEAIKSEIRCYINGVLRREFRKLTNSTTVQVVAPETQAAAHVGVLGGAQVEGGDDVDAQE